jgi:hypothetical protein
MAFRFPRVNRWRHSIGPTQSATFFLGANVSKTFRNSILGTLHAPSSNTSALTPAITPLASTNTRGVRATAGAGSDRRVLKLKPERTRWGQSRAGREPPNGLVSLRYPSATRFQARVLPSLPTREPPLACVRPPLGNRRPQQSFVGPISARFILERVLPHRYPPTIRKANSIRFFSARIRRTGLFPLP